MKWTTWRWLKFVVLLTGMLVITLFELLTNGNYYNISIVLACIFFTAFLICEFIFWRCPNCGSYLPKGFYIEHCSKCGEKLTKN